VRRVNRRVAVALAVGLTLTAIALCVVLLGSPVTVAGTNGIPANPGVAYAKGGSSGCQLIGTLPRGTSAIRLSVSQNTGPRVTMKVFSGPLLIAQGERPAGWGIDESVTLPIKRVARSIPNARLCLTFGQAIEAIEINGAEVRTTTASGRIASGVRFRVEYLQPDHRSWWSLVGSVARLMGLGHAPGGTWIVFLLLALMITIATLASWLVLRELR
jgi:hypothetical protein